MAMAVAVGGFTPGQADALRRAMGAWRKRGGLEPLVEQLMQGLRDNGITDAYAERIAKQIAVHAATTKKPSAGRPTSVAKVRITMLGFRRAMTVRK